MGNADRDFGQLHVNKVSGVILRQVKEVRNALQAQQEGVAYLSVQEVLREALKRGLASLEVEIQTGQKVHGGWEEDDNDPSPKRGRPPQTEVEREGDRERAQPMRPGAGGRGIPPTFPSVGEAPPPFIPDELVDWREGQDEQWD